MPVQVAGEQGLNYIHIVHTRCFIETSLTVSSNICTLSVV